MSYPRQRSWTDTDGDELTVATLTDTVELDIAQHTNHCMSTVTLDRAAAAELAKLLTDWLGFALMRPITQAEEDVDTAAWAPAPTLSPPTLPGTPPTDFDG